MSSIFSVQFWLNQRPDLLTSTAKIFLFSFLAILLLSAIISMILKLRKGFYSRFWSKLFNFSVSNLLIGLVLFFFCWQLIPLLSSRFWFLLWGAGMIFWLTLIFRYAKTFPAKKKELEKQKELKKYIP